MNQHLFFLGVYSSYSYYSVHDVTVNQCLDEPTSVPNAQINIISRVFEEVPANISCDFGYEYSDGTESQLINCTLDDQGALMWAEPEYAVCQRKYSLFITINAYIIDNFSSIFSPPIGMF